MTGFSLRHALNPRDRIESFWMGFGACALLHFAAILIAGAILL